MFPKKTRKCIASGNLTLDPNSSNKYKLYIVKNNTNIDRWRHISYFLELHAYDEDVPKEYFMTRTPIGYPQFIKDFEIDTPVKKVRNENIKRVTNMKITFIDENYNDVEVIKFNIKSVGSLHSLRLVPMVE